MKKGRQKGTVGENSDEGRRGSGDGFSGVVFLASLDWKPKRRSRSFSAAADANVGLSPAAGLRSTHAPQYKSVLQWVAQGVQANR